MKLLIVLSLLFLAGCTTVQAVPSPSVKVVTVEKEVIREVPVIKEVKTIEYVYVDVPKTVYEYLYKAPRQFKDGDEIRDYLTGRPVLMPMEGQDCDDLARFFTLDALEAGYLVSQQYLPYWHGGEHMLVMALTDSNGIYYIEPQTNQYWWVSPID